MELNRKPFQGVSNIVRFNWHFYLIAGLVFITIGIINLFLPQSFQLYVFGLALAAILPIVLSLVVSYYIYDLSGLYQFKWFPNFDNKSVLNINAGFDETSSIVKARYPASQLTVCDFYDPKEHTEVSVKRARKLYPPPKGTIPVTSEQLPFAENTFDFSLAILSAHEIRDEEERINFFKELNRITKEGGQILVTEHLRDLNNFLAYTIGFLHFHSKKSWLQTFEQANLVVKKEVSTTPFITTFVLENNGNTF